MSDFDDAIGDMTTDLLTEAGGAFVYLRGNAASSLTLRKSTLQPQQMEAGDGMVIEVRPVDFIGLTIDFPYTEPLRGDRIKGGGLTFEVQSQTGEKVFRMISPQMIRIHTKQVG